MRFGSVSYLNAPAKVLRERLRRTFAGGLAPPQRGRAGAPEGGGHRISDITGGPRNPALTRVITGPNGPPDIYMISTSMPWVATAGYGWKRNVESGVNGAEIAAVLQQKMQIPAYLHTCIPAQRISLVFHLHLVWQMLCICLHVACIKQTSFGLT